MRRRRDRSFRAFIYLAAVIDRYSRCVLSGNSPAPWMSISVARNSFADPSKLPHITLGRLSPKRSGVLSKPLSVPSRIAAVQVRRSASWVPSSLTPMIARRQSPASVRALRQIPSVHPESWGSWDRSRRFQGGRRPWPRPLPGKAGTRIAGTLSEKGRERRCWLTP